MIVVCDSSFLLQLGMGCVGDIALPTDVSALSGVFVSAIAMGSVSSTACL